MATPKNTGILFNELTEIMARLRGEGGCPWDREQTHGSLKPYLLEEAYELTEAIEQGEQGELEEELGDVLLQILFHCQIAAEQGRFGPEQVMTRLKEKLIRRHPHVFSDRHLPDSDAVLQNWAKMKAKENNIHSPESSLGKLPNAMPALTRAQRVGERASQLGFDWPEMAQVWEKLEEEIRELKETVHSGNKARRQEEMGDVFFTFVNLCRFLDLEAEESLRQTTERFLKRFAYIEGQVREKGKDISETSFEEMDSLWDEAKKQKL